MTYFEQALSAPELHFKRLRGMEPTLYNGRVSIRRTALAIETEIRWEQGNYLLLLPFKSESLRHIESLEITAMERSRGPLIRNRILYDELTMCDALGHKSSFDVILQEIPRGMTLNDAVLHYKALDLKIAISNMKKSLDKIGFLHNNLRPTNIVICENGIACPLRYWYAEWHDFAENNTSQLELLIEQHNIPELEGFKQPLLIQQVANDVEPIDTPCEGIIRCRRGHRYGFIDSDGVQIAPFIYTDATNFREGRAIVSRNNKMGAIDNLGRKVIAVAYEHLEFDIMTGFFTATRGKYRYTLDYDGNIICRQTEEKTNE